MADLQRTQNQLLDAIFATTPNTEFSKQGLTVYRANLRATATRALTITFPTVLEMIGEELLSHAADRLLQIDPPRAGDWAQWGVELPQVLAEMPELADYPFVAECAALDYRCHQLVRAADVFFERSSLDVMQHYDADDIIVDVNPTLELFTTRFPVAGIRAAHRIENTQLRQQALAKAAQETIHVEACFGACLKSGYDMLVLELSALEYRWLNLLKTSSLGHALTAIEGTDFAFEKWLPKAVNHHLILRCRPKT